jgi:hypothetical protein
MGLVAAEHEGRMAPGRGWIKSIAAILTKYGVRTVGEWGGGKRLLWREVEGTSPQSVAAHPHGKLVSCCWVSGLAQLAVSFKPLIASNTNSAGPGDRGAACTQNCRGRRDVGHGVGADMR